MSVEVWNDCGPVAKAIALSQRNELRKALRFNTSLLLVLTPTCFGRDPRFLVSRLVCVVVQIQDPAQNWVLAR
jgi:hypothetical protein